MGRGRIRALAVSDVRFPTSLTQHGSDAMHPDPDYSAAYVVIETDAPNGLKGCGFTFTLGKGTEVVISAVHALSIHIINKDLDDIISDFRGFYRQLTSDGQLRWIGPEKGAVHLATAAILNAVWDLWAKQEGKPLWKLLVDMDPKQLLSCIDFRYITDALTEEEAFSILQSGLAGKKNGLCTEALKDGWTRFKVKVGKDLQDDIRRCKLVREMIGPENILLLDANQRWEVEEAIDWVTELAEFKPLWIEEPTSPDDVLGHATIAKALAPLGIGVATGEQCHNRVMFKQFLQAQSLSYLQVDSCRLGSVNENLSVLLMAKKFQIPVCPHAGGVGLCELVQHLIIFDYISVSGSLEKRMCEYVDHLHEHFKSPVVIMNASYMPPQDAGYSSEMKEDSVKKYLFPQGEIWQKFLCS
ncbi:mitochondrial enolase superfamily member 1 isoform X1 [Thamnophis elegans]|uniref:mitochondrial enolase superfamily member 1 isoform X1 n=1 Tax=Thamnophis elegans TaxID=35005 RepID=UPI00137839BF|nr:mitochondrial enolase superfamily member 1 isoform X1 [Thamnophis elegans]